MYATNNPPTTVREMIAWLNHLGRPPLPECPIEAAKQGKDPKAPCYFDGRRVISIQWKEWQHQQPIEEITKAWFAHPKTGIGTLGGWNGQHWIGWIDFDAKNFPTPELCDRQVQAWVSQYPVLAQAPSFRTPSGGYRFLIAFDTEPKNFKANSGFSLNQDGSVQVGELLSKNGAHTLLPPTVGVSGRAYEWTNWAEYPPVVTSPEDVGLYPVSKKKDDQASRRPERENGSSDHQLTDFLERQIYPRLDADRLFKWSGHNFQSEVSGKIKGCCPWHESKSGTAFYAEQKNGTWLWRCPACELGGGPIEYRYLLGGGNGSPRGREFIEVVKALADEVGVELPHQYSTPTAASSPKVVPLHQPPRLSEEQLLIEIDKLINQEPESSRLQLKLTGLAQETGQSLHQLEQLYHKRLGEVEHRQNLEEEFPTLESLIQYQIGNQIDWETCLPNALTKALLTKSEASRIDPVFLIQNLFPAVGGLLGAKIGLVGQLGGSVEDHWIEYPNIWTVTIADPSSGKSVADRAILNPIRRIQDKELDRHEKAREELDRVEAAWSILNKQEKLDLQDTLDNPIVFKATYVGNCRKYLLKEGEVEAIKRRISEQPIKAGCLWNNDELIGLFNGLDQYKFTGRGNGRQFLLDAWSAPLTGYVDRVNENESFRFRQQLLTLCGGMQTKPAAKFFNPDGDNCDSDGLQSRLLPAVPPLHPAFDQWSEVQVNLDGVLQDLYEKLDRIPAGLVYLSAQAKALWVKQWQKFKKGYKTYLHKNPAFAYFLGKMCSNQLRLALLIHAIEHCYQPKFDFFVLDEETFSRALKVADYYVGQFRLAQVQFTQSPEDGLSEFLMKILQMALEEGRLTPSAVVNRFRRRRGAKGKSLRSPEVKEMFETIAKAKPQLVTYDGKALVKKSENAIAPVKNTIGIRTPDRTLEPLQNGHSSQKYVQIRSDLSEKTAKNDEKSVQPDRTFVHTLAETLDTPSLDSTIGRSYFDRILDKGDRTFDSYETEIPPAVGGSNGHYAVNPDLEPLENQAVEGELELGNRAEHSFSESVQKYDRAEQTDRTFGESIKKGDWGRLLNMGTDSGKLVHVAKEPDSNGSFLVSEHGSPELRHPYGAFVGALYSEQFSHLTKNECLALGLSKRKNQTGVLYSVGNFPQVGDRVETAYGMKGEVVRVVVKNRNFAIQWDGDQIRHFDLKDLQIMETRRVDGDC